MNLIKSIIKKKILSTYGNFSEEFLQKLKIIQKDLLNIKICNDKNLDLTLKGSLYNFLILPYFSKFFIFFYSFKIPMIFPLPFSHLIFLKKNGIRCFISLSLTFFYIFIFYISIKKTFIALKKILSVKKSNAFDNKINIFFPKVTDTSQITNINNYENNYTFIESAVYALNLKPNNIFHNNNDIPNFIFDNIKYSYGFPINGISFKYKIILIFTSILNFIYFSLFTFSKWYNLYLLDQITYKNFFRFSNSSKKTDQINHVIYDFHDQLLRPYWTYFTNNNYKFHLINSASGFYGFKNKNAQYPTDTMYHHLCNWDNYYVDSPIFYDHIKKIIPNCILLNEKISPFHVSEKQSFDYPNVIKIAIFDVIPHHLYSRAFMLPEDRYRISEICINFLKDILICTASKNVLIFLKSKHNLNSKSYPLDYINFIKNIDNKNIIKLNPRYSPKLISKNVHFSISSPFTTAAFYQTIENFNFFYDPDKTLYTDDRARQNLSLISGIDALKKHLEYLLKKIGCE